MRRPSSYSSHLDNQPLESSAPGSTSAGFLHEWIIKNANEKTAFKVAGAKTLATNAVSGWNEIDAVQLIGE